MMGKAASEQNLAQTGRLPISAILLNGGKASRYGGFDKQSLEIGGVAIGHHLALTLRAAAQELLVIGRLHAMYDGLADGQYTDERQGRGPLSGLDCAMRWAKFDWVFLCASDMPFASLTLIQYLYDKAASGRAESVLCETGGVFQPLFAFYSKALAPEISARLESGSCASLKDIILRRPCEIVNEAELCGICDPALAFFNINDPASYEKAVREAARNGLFGMGQV